LEGVLLRFLLSSAHVLSVGGQAGPYYFGFPPIFRRETGDRLRTCARTPLFFTLDSSIGFHHFFLRICIAMDDIRK
jgi:hypothetical protein